MASLVRCHNPGEPDTVWLDERDDPNDAVNATRVGLRLWSCCSMNDVVGTFHIYPIEAFLSIARNVQYNWRRLTATNHMRQIVIKRES